MLGLLVALIRGALLLWKFWTQGERTLALPGNVTLRMVHLSPGEFIMGFDTDFKATEPPSPMGST